eukprot:gene31688-41133_t
MNRANQQALSQTTNMILVNIRNAEISYFNNFFSSFGVIAGLIITIVLGCVSQVPGADFEGSYAWKILFWYGSTVAVIAGTHILICTIFLSVFGQEHVMFTFVLLIFALTVASIGMYGIMMDEYNSVWNPKELQDEDDAEQVRADAIYGNDVTDQVLAKPMQEKVAQQFHVLLQADQEIGLQAVWKFRCDTMAEFRRWVEIFSSALKIIDEDDGTAAIRLEGGDDENTLQTNGETFAILSNAVNNAIKNPLNEDADV